MQRNMCVSIDILHMTCIPSLLDTATNGHYLLLYGSPKITNQLHMSWIIHYYNFTWVHWSPPVANIKAKIFPFKCDPIILLNNFLKKFKRTSLSMYHSDSRMRTWFFLSPPQLWARRFSSVPLTWASAEHGHILKDLLEFGVNNIRFFPVLGLSCRWNPMEFTWGGVLYW
jgi:hypothetical protein